MTRIIYPNQRNGVSIIIPTDELPIDAVAAKDVPPGVPYRIIDDCDIPVDRVFRDAWIYDDHEIKIDLNRARAIAHDIRRRRRAEELAPHDRMISLQIPGANTDKAEAARQEIRTRYNAMQDAIDAASSPEEIKTALSFD